MSLKVCFMLANKKFWSSKETEDKFIKNGQLLYIAIGCVLLTCHLANSGGGAVISTSIQSISIRRICYKIDASQNCPNDIPSTNH
jgi:hypothetical protein